MTQSQYIISRKTNIVELGRTLGNISEACRKLGVSRTHYYDIRKAIEEEGLQGLLEKSRRAPRIGNRVAPEIEQKVLDYSLEFPTQGQVRASNELKKLGACVSAGGIRSIWLRHELEMGSLDIHSAVRPLGLETYGWSFRHPKRCAAVCMSWVLTSTVMPRRRRPSRSPALPMSRPMSSPCLSDKASAVPGADRRKNPDFRVARRAPSGEVECFSTAVSGRR